MLLSSRGSASLLFMVVVLPFLCISLVVGIEVSQFFGLREEVQQLLDSEAKASLGRSHTAAQVSRRIESRVESLKPYVSVSRIETSKTPRHETIMVTGAYRGLFAQLVGFLAGGGSGVIPFELSTTVRRARTAALVVIDRSVGVTGVVCGDDNLSRRAILVDRLVRDLHAFGVDTVHVGVTPGIGGEIDILSPTDEVSRCGGLDASSPLRIPSVEGVSDTAAVDPLSLAYRAVQLLFSSALPADIEQRALIMVAPPREARTEAITTTFSLLESEAARQRVKVTAVGIAVGDSAGRELFSIRSQSGRSKYLHLSEDDVGGGDVRAALVHHIQGHTFVAR